MKRLKQVFLLLITLILIIGVSGCMQNQNNESKIEEMKNYATEKYGKSFSVEYFHAAKDSTYTNILTLSDGNHTFNVYQGGDSNQITDDYPRVIIDKKFSDYLKSNSQYNLENVEFYTRIMLTSNTVFDFDYASSKTFDDILKESDIQKIILIIKTSDDIEALKDDLFRSYSAILSLNPEYIDFEVIVVNQADLALERVLTNLTAYYDNDWEKVDAIKSYLAVTQTDIQSAERLIEGVK